MIWPFSAKKDRRHAKTAVDGLRDDGTPAGVLDADDVRKVRFRSKNGGRYYLSKDVDAFLESVVDSIEWYRGEVTDAAGSELVGDHPTAPPEAVGDLGAGDGMTAVDLPLPDVPPLDDGGDGVDVDHGGAEPPQAPVNPFTGLPMSS